MPALQEDSQVIWQNYIDLNSDVKRWLNIPLTDTSRDPDIQDTIDTACWWVQDFLKRPVAPTWFFRRFNPPGISGPFLQLPYYPVLQVPLLGEWWGFSGEHILTEQSPASQGGSDMYQLLSNQGIIIRTFMGLVARPWFPGYRNVEVTWQAGFSPIPPPIKMATREFVKWWWSNTQQAYRTGNSFVRQAGYDEQDPRPGIWDGVPNHISMLLESYQQIGMG